MISFSYEKTANIQINDARVHEVLPIQISSYYSLGLLAPPLSVIWNVVVRFPFIVIQPGHV